MNTPIQVIKPTATLANSKTTRTVLCLLACWLGLVLNAVAGPPPTISSQPTNQTVLVGGTATFSVVASGNGYALTYQWYFQSNAIPGATGSSYVITNAQLANAGTYYVAVNNGNGIVNSSNATLTVIPIVVDNTSSGSITSNTTLTWSHTVGNGVNRILIVGVSIRDGNKSITGVSYAGQNLTLIGQQTDTGSTIRVALYRLIAPPVGTNNVTVNISGNSQISAGAVSFTGVSQTDPLDTFASASGSGSSGSVNVPSSSTELVIDIMGTTGDTLSLTPGGNQTQQWNVSTGTGGGDAIGASSTQIGSPTNTMSWTLGSNGTWNICAVSLVPASSTLTWNTFLGNSTLPDMAEAVAVDSSGNVYVTGYSDGTWGSPVKNFGSGSQAAFVAKLNSTGSVVWSTFLGGAGGASQVSGTGIAVDTNGNVYVTGYSTVTFGSPIRAFSGTVNGYVAKLTSSGTLTWNTFLGGTGFHWGSGVTLDASGNIYVAGYSSATWGSPVMSFIGTNSDAYVAKLNSSGSLTWNTFLGGTGYNYAYGIALDGGGNVYVAGYSGATWGTPVQTFGGGGDDAFAAKLNSSGSLTWNTFLGGSGADYGYGIAVDSSTNVYVSGSSTAAWGTPVAPFVSGQDIFVAKLNSSGGLTWNTFPAGNAAGDAYGVAVDSNGNVSFAGDGGATWGNPLRAYTSGSDAYVGELNSSGSLIWNTFLGGSGTDYGNGLAADGSGNFYVAGASTSGWGSPVNPFGNTNQYDAFVAKLFVPLADVQVTKTGPGSVNAASNLTYTITVTNLGPNTATNLVVSDVLPTNSTFVSASGGGVNASGTVTWTFTSFTNTAMTNFTVTVTAPASGTMSNVVSSIAGSYDPNAANNNGSATNAQVITTIPLADIVTTQSGPTSVNPFTNVTYTVTVSNQGPSTASNVVVSDTLASKFNFVSASAGGTYLAGVVTWPAVVSLASGAATNFTVTVASPNKGTLTNIASSVSVTGDPNPTNNNGSAAAAQVVTAVTSLKVANTSSGGSVSTLNWSHTISPGSGRILIVGLSIDSPSTAVVAATFANTFPLTLIGQTNGTQTKVLMYYLLNPPVGSYPISITLNAASGIVGGAVSFNGVDQVNPITAFAGNTGTGSLASVTVASTLGGVVVDTVAPKSPQRANAPGTGQTAAWNLSATNYSGAGSTTPGAASVSPNWTLSGNPNWAMCAVALNPAQILADVSLTATGPTNVLAGANLTYSLTVTNLGSDSATNVVASDVLPAGAAFVSASSGGTNNAGVVSWPPLTNFVNGATTNYTVTITAPGSGPLTNIAYSTASTADPDPSNNNGTGTNNQVVTIVTPLADVATTVSGPPTVFAATNFSYVVSLTNQGPSTAGNVLVSNTLPATVQFGSATGSGTNYAGVVVWSISSLASGVATNFTVNVTAPASGTLTNTVLSTALTGDPNPANNNGSATNALVVTTVTPLADVATTVTGPAIVLAGANFAYVVSVTNQGPSTAGNVLVSNSLPATVQFGSASGGGSNYAGVVVWAIPSLANGAATNYTINVTAPASGTLTNTVLSMAFTGDPNPANNNGTATNAQVVTTVTALADVATTVSGPAIVYAGTNFSYAILVTNQGPSTANDVLVSNTLPATVQFGSASGSGANYAGVVVWSIPNLNTGAATNYTVNVTAPASGTLTNTVTSSAATSDPNAANNNGTATNAQVISLVYPLPSLTGQWIPGVGLQMQCNAPPNVDLSIEASTNLVDWQILFTTNSASGLINFIDQDYTGYQYRFYRTSE